MKKITLNKTARSNFLTYGGVTVAFAVLQIMASGGLLTSTLKGQLVPICAYVVAALSLNLTVGILGELSLGHAGFMSVGAFVGAVTASALRDTVTSDPLRLIFAMILGAAFAALAGFLIGIPVLRLNGDYLAIVTLAFGQIIKTIMENLYIGLDAKGLHWDFLTNDIVLAKGGRMILNGPMGINIQKISTFAAGFILIMLTLMFIFNLNDERIKNINDDLKAGIYADTSAHKF